MIWAILILTSIYSLAAPALATGHERAMEAARQAMRHDRPTAVLGCLLGATPWFIAACWVVYAVQVGDWRFAAIAVVPKAAAILIGAARFGRTQ